MRLFFKVVLFLSFISPFANGHSFSLSGIVEKAIQSKFSQTEKFKKPDQNSTSSLPASTGNFGNCLEQFAGGENPIVQNQSDKKARALCFDGFAVLYSGATRTPIYTASVLNRDKLNSGKGLARTNAFFEDARLPSSERATLNDYKKSGFDRGHNFPAGDSGNANTMAQSFSLANMMPQAPENNRKLWNDIEQSTRKYVMRAKGNVYVYTGSILLPGSCVINMPKCTIGNGVVVPSHIFKLVYDATTKKAWAHWVENTDTARIGAPISYKELVTRTGIEFLPNIQISN